MDSPMIGKVIDNYRILEMLGKGGMGIVYKAIDVNMEKVVALKMMNPMLAHDEVFLKRFREEARALAKSENRHIVNVYALRETEHGLVLVMEFVNGANLEQTLAQSGALPYQEALPLFKQLLAAIAHAHRVGVIHRDLKPSNVMITPEQEVKVTDFGLARIQRPGSTTRTMSTGGTLFYMSPEQVQELPDVDHRSDIYSLGMTFYEMLAGRTPFQKGQSDLATANAIVSEKFLPPNQLNAEVPAELARITMKAIEKERTKRFQSADAMLAAITAFENKLVSDETQLLIEPAPVRRKRITGLAVAVVLALLIAAMYWIISARQSSSSVQAKLFISTIPENVMVFLNGDSIGITPINDFSVFAGTHALRFHKQDFLTLDTMLVVTESRLLPIFVALQASARVSIKMSPPDAVVMINGRVVAPQQLHNLELGAGQHDLQASRDGYETLEKRLQVQPGSNPQKFFALRKLPESTSIPSAPPDTSTTNWAPITKATRKPVQQLRSKAAILTEAQVREMLKRQSFFDANVNRNSSGIAHDYESVRVGGDGVIVDHATGLMWQSGGSMEKMTLTEAVHYVQDLKAQRFAGFNDWRLPTLEEGMSLMEPKAAYKDLHISSRFDAKQSWLWTTDAQSNEMVWGVDFSLGYCGPVKSDRAGYVRAVRTKGQSE